MSNAAPLDLSLKQMKHEDIYSQLKEAKTKMEYAQKGNDHGFTLDRTYRRFVKARQRYWELLDKLRAESEEKRRILEEIYSGEANLPEELGTCE